MAHTTCLVCFISTLNGRSKIKENALEDVALVAGTQQNLSNLYSLDIYDIEPSITVVIMFINVASLTIITYDHHL
jgi:hypothetical protein